MRYTLEQPFSYQEVIKKSQFVVHALPLSAKEQVPALLAQYGDPAANHNCWAWQIGLQYRFSDDGEPSGTAGKPIFTAITQQYCDQLLLLVTRYFGGIKLGAGGLIRAYHGVAVRCLQQAPLITLIAQCSGMLQCSYAQWPKIQNQLQNWQATIISQDFSSEYIITQLSIAEAYVAALQAYINDVSKGQFTFQLQSE